MGGRFPSSPSQTASSLADWRAVDVGHTGRVGANHARLIGEEVTLSGRAHGDGRGRGSVAIDVAAGIRRSGAEAEAALHAASQNRPTYNVHHDIFWLFGMTCFGWSCWP